VLFGEQIAARQDPITLYTIMLSPYGQQFHVRQMCIILQLGVYPYFRRQLLSDAAEPRRVRQGSKKQYTEDEIALVRETYFAHKSSQQIRDALRAKGRDTHWLDGIMRASIGLQRDNRRQMAPVQPPAQGIWTSDEVTVLCERRAQAVPPSEIAFELNRSVASIQYKLHSLFYRSWQKEEVESFWQGG